MTDHSVRVGERVRSTHDQTRGTVQKTIETTTGPLAIVKADDGRKVTGYVGLSLEREGGDE